MNCFDINTCFHNRTIEIVDKLTENVIQFNGSFNGKSIQLFAPMLISIGVLDHIRRAIDLSRGRIVFLESDRVLNWRDFYVSIAMTALSGLSGLPGYLDAFDTARKLDSITKKVLEFDLCSKFNKPTSLASWLERSSDELNKSASPAGPFLLTSAAIVAIACVAMSVNVRDYRVNGQLKLFRAHKINYAITYVSLVLFFAFQTYVLARFDFYPVELKESYQACLDKSV